MMTFQIVEDFRPARMAARGLPLAVAVKRLQVEHYAKTTRSRQSLYIGKQIAERDPHGTVEQVNKAYLRKFIHEMRTVHNNSAGSINIKLAFFSRMFSHFEDELIGPDGRAGSFEPPTIPWEHKTKEEKLNSLKWWLRPELEAKVCAWLQSNDDPSYADYVAFVTHSGLRVEEALRLQRHNFDFVKNLLTVPGTKTGLAHRVIPMFSAARDIAMRRFGDECPPMQYLFNFSPLPTDTDTVENIVARNYRLLGGRWIKVRCAFGLHRTPTATVKALRRTFARYASDRGMPTEMLRDYLGHEKIETTQGYLRLVGGPNIEVMRKYVA